MDVAAVAADRFAGYLGKVLDRRGTPRARVSFGRTTTGARDRWNVLRLGRLPRQSPLVRTRLRPLGFHLDPRSLSGLRVASRGIGRGWPWGGAESSVCCSEVGAQHVDGYVVEV